MVFESYLFGKNNDKAIFKQDNVYEKITKLGLENSYLWLNKENILPVKKYLYKESNEHIVLNINETKHNHNEIILYNNNSFDFIKYKIDKKYNLSKGDIIEVNKKPLDRWKKIDNITIYKNNSKKTINKFKDNYSLYPRYSGNLESIRDELVYYILRLNKNNMKLCLNMLEDYWEDIMTLFASHSHHQYIGGLLVHIVENIRMYEKIMYSSLEDREDIFKYVFDISSDLEWEYLKEYRKGNYKVNSQMDIFMNDFSRLSNEILIGEIDISYDDMVVAYIFHDIGKLFDMNNLYTRKDKYYKSNLEGIITTDNEYNTLVTLDKNGSIYGHPYLSSIILNTYYTRLSDTDGVNLARILRIIATHHCKIAYGSIQEAKTSTEKLIHYCDKISAFYSTEYRLFLDFYDNDDIEKVLMNT